MTGGVKIFSRGRSRRIFSQTVNGRSGKGEDGALTARLWQWDGPLRYRHYLPPQCQISVEQL